MRAHVLAVGKPSALAVQLELPEGGPRYVALSPDATRVEACLFATPQGYDLPLPPQPGEPPNVFSESDPGDALRLRVGVHPAPSIPSGGACPGARVYGLGVGGRSPCMLVERRGPAGLVVVLMMVVPRVGLGLGAGATTARADVGPPALREPGVYLPVGGSLGVSLGGGEAGVTVGAEASVVTIHIVGELVWLGGYVDGVWDARTDAGRISIGPEIGYTIFGVDGGYVASIDGVGYRHGVTGRVIATVGFIAVYARATHLAGARAETIGELGLLLKYPIPIRGPAIEL